MRKIIVTGIIIGTVCLAACKTAETQTELESTSKETESVQEVASTEESESESESVESESVSTEEEPLQSEETSESSTENWDEEAAKIRESWAGEWNAEDGCRVIIEVAGMDVAYEFYNAEGVQQDFGDISEYADWGFRVMSLSDEGRIDRDFLFSSENQLEIRQNVAVFGHRGDENSDSYTEEQLAGIEPIQWSHFSTDDVILVRKE